MKKKKDCGVIIDEYIQMKCAENAGECFVSNFEAQMNIVNFGLRQFNSSYLPDTYRRLLEMKTNNSIYSIRKLTDEEKESLGKKRGFTVYKCELKEQFEMELR